MATSGPPLEQATAVVLCAVHAFNLAWSARVDVSAGPGQLVHLDGLGHCGNTLHYLWISVHIDLVLLSVVIRV